MIVADHCRPGRHSYNNHTPLCAWPDDCYVQWGGRGVVLPASGTGVVRRTAFFEAFTGWETDDTTFIRGEGVSVADAERDAFAKWHRYEQCAKHEFERRQYTNGAGFCKHCGMFKSGVFEPLPPTAKELEQDHLLEKAFGGDAEALDFIIGSVIETHQIPDNEWPGAVGPVQKDAHGTTPD